MEAFPKYTTSRDTKQINTNSKRLRSLQFLSDFNAIKLKIDSKQISRKYKNSRAVNNSSLNRHKKKSRMKSNTFN